MMTDPPAPDAEAVAREVRDAFASAAPLVPFTRRPGGLPMTTAYDAARCLRQWRCAAGDLVVGRKIGFTNRSIWPRYGVWEPIWGAVYRSSLARSDTPSMRISLAGAFEPRIEPEIVLHLASAPAPGDGIEELAARIDLVAHGVEIVQSPYPGWSFGAADTVAVGSLHHALAVGPALPVGELGPDWPAALRALVVELQDREGPRDRGEGNAALGGPLEALAHLVRVLGERPADEALAAGEWVTTGTLTDAFPVAPGERWRTVLGGIALPGIEVGFDA